MLRIGLLISDFKKEDVCDFCVGAIRAAEKEEILLTIMPGGSFLSDEQKKTTIMIISRLLSLTMSAKITLTDYS